MKTLMQYHIISGNVIETRRCYMPHRTEGKKRRGTRIAGSSSEKKIKINERDAVRRLARTLNCNFGEGLTFLTLKYSNERLPKSYEEARQYMQKVLRQLRAKHKEITGKALKAVITTANWSPKRNCPARLHHHIVMESSISLDLIAECWPSDEMHIRRVGKQKDLSYLAAYLLENVKLEGSNQKKYSVTQNMEKPKYTEPVPVDDCESITPMPQTYVLEAAPTYNEEGAVVGSYMRCFAYQRPKVKGSMVILPKKKKGEKLSGNHDADLRGVLQEDE